jgi:hypothetical protein
MNALLLSVVLLGAPKPVGELSDGLLNCTPTRLEVPAGGRAITVTADTRALRRGLFWVTARTLKLELSEHGTWLATSSMICAGRADPVCHESLSLPLGQTVRTLTVTLRPRGAAAASDTVNFCVLDPLE